MWSLGRIILCLWIGGALLGQSGSPAAAGNGEGAGPLPVLKVGYPQYAFSEVDIKDAQAALEIWTKQILNRTLYSGTKVTIYPEEASLLRALETNEVNLAVLASTTFLKVKDKLPIEPFFVPSSRGQVGEEFCLLVHQQSGPASAAQLKNGKLLYYPRCSADSPQRLWLEDFLKRQGLPGIEGLFHSVQVAEGASQTVLPVFFRKADACFLPRQIFETVAEMNPQLGRDLKVLSQSPPIIRGLLVIRHDMDGKLKEEVYNSFLAMDKQAQGKQILTLLRYDRLVPYKPSHLATTVDCLQRLKMSEANPLRKKGL
jgi:ABC-type phosphate/phosphonate transport system substrate-binding protein